MRLVHPVTSELEPDPLEAGQIVEGDPRTADLLLAEDEPGGETVGFWSCEPGVFTDVESTERFLVIDGRARIEFEDGRTAEVGPGDTLAFEGGERTTWTVTEKLLKVYWIADPA